MSIAGLEVLSGRSLVRGLYCWGYRHLETFCLGILWNKMGLLEIYIDWAFGELSLFLSQFGSFG